MQPVHIVGNDRDGSAAKGIENGSRNGGGLGLVRWPISGMVLNLRQKNGFDDNQYVTSQ
ncbi:hypothetical protein [Bosea sp. 685]|uniref:hypothetical protein n=1 Tax=Bosea sp. 685 TaxID=3080057 RepID=UPI002892EE19|nr:hypothetical protein [Bosea sp. 685]WNJ94138.1 hypothetical protein RMR04_16620 [Bosea sp. 685]